MVPFNLPPPPRHTHTHTHKAGGGATVQFSPPDTSVVVSEGQPYTVTCQSRCAPECQVTWTRGGKPVPTASGNTLQVCRSDRILVVVLTP